MGRYHYFLNTTYSKTILPFLQEKFGDPTFNVIKNYQELLNEKSWIIINPAFDESTQKLLQSLPDKIKVLLLIDWNSHAFPKDIESTLASKRINLILSPWKIKTQVPQKIIPGIHSEMMKQKIVLKKLNSHDLFFCSQPLLEDRPDLGLNQFDLIRKLIKSNPQNANIYLKRHPREVTQIPDDILNNSSVKIWEKSIEEALAIFKNWYGHSSIALYDAKALGHNVTFMDNQGSLK